MIVKFITRPAWDGNGDLEVNGEDQGWQTREDAERFAAAAGVKLVVEIDADYVVRNPRREA